MIIAKTTRYGIDVPIYLAQSDLQESLPWADMTKVAIYGKIQRTTKDGVTIPEAYVTSGEYKDVFIDDRWHAVIGFIVDEVREGFQADVSAVFTVQLNKIHGNNNRDDEKALLEGIRALGYSPELVEIREGIDSVFSGFDIDSIANRDMGKWFVFSVRTTMYYSDNYCL